jgi:hypothetical protein
VVAVSVGVAEVAVEGARDSLDGVEADVISANEVTTEVDVKRRKLAFL